MIDICIGLVNIILLIKLTHSVYKVSDQYTKIYKLVIRLLAEEEFKDKKQYEKLLKLRKHKLSGSI